MELGYEESGPAGVRGRSGSKGPSVNSMVMMFAMYMFFWGLDLLAWLSGWNLVA